MAKTVVRAVRCSKCGDTIFSRARHDFRSCSCGAVAIDGGFDYIRLIGEMDEKAVFQMQVEASLEELYNDYNLNLNKFGLIHPQHKAIRWYKLFKDERKEKCDICHKKFSHFSRVIRMRLINNKDLLLHPGCERKMYE